MCVYVFKCMCFCVLFQRFSLVIDTLGVSRCHNTLYSSSLYFCFIIGNIRDLSVSCVDSLAGLDNLCEPNVLNNRRSKGRGVMPSKTSLSSARAYS